MSYKMYGKKLDGHGGCQCRVQIDKEHGIIDFISYTTLVIRAYRNDCDYKPTDCDIWVKNTENTDGEYWLLKCTGTYSRTTARQISYFLREYFANLDYYAMKEIAGTDTLAVAHLTKKGDL